MIIVTNPKACTGCLICELACSFHHIGKYSKSHSSIKVIKCIFNPERDPKITISYEKEEGTPVCDLCKKEELPLCIKFCPEDVFKFEEVLA